MAQLGKRSLETLKGVHPNLIKVMQEAIKETPVDFTITDGGRTTKEQQALFAKGRTAPGEIVTKMDGVKKKSNHQAKADGFYHAVDLYPYVNGAVDFNDKHGHLNAIAAHILATAKCMGIKIGWGGYFGSAIGEGWDKPHFELL